MDQGIGLKSLQDPIDTRSPSGKLVFHIFAALAEFERGVIHEWTTAGLQAARERGRVGGRPPALSAKDLQAAKALLKDSDITVAAVARRLNVATSTLYRHIPPYKKCDFARRVLLNHQCGFENSAQCCHQPDERKSCGKQPGLGVNLKVALARYLVECGLKIVQIMAFIQISK